MGFLALCCLRARAAVFPMGASARGIAYRRALGGCRSLLARLRWPGSSSQLQTELIHPLRLLVASTQYNALQK
jgi:hypothetical protein